MLGLHHHGEPRLWAPVTGPVQLIAEAPAGPSTGDVLAAIDTFVMDGAWQEWPQYVSREIVRRLLLAWETEGRPA